LPAFPLRQYISLDIGTRKTPSDARRRGIDSLPALHPIDVGEFVKQLQGFFLASPANRADLGGLL
jgi:hypothetical protein